MKANNDYDNDNYEDNDEDDKVDLDDYGVIDSSNND